MSNQPPSHWGDPPWGAKPVAGGGRRGPGSSGSVAGGTVGTAPGSRPIGPGPPGPPPPGPPPPGRPPGAAPAGKKKGRGLLVGVLGLLLMILVAIIAGFILLVIWVVSMARGPIDATNTFVANLDEGRIEAAHQSLCAELRTEVTLQEFAAQVAPADRITGYTFVSAAVRSNDMTIVSGTIDLDEVPMAADFGLREESGIWRVCRFEPLG